jgi:methionyl-tRNA formyltransferase
MEQAPAPFDKYDKDNLLLTASFGHIIPNELLNKFDPAHRLNVHPSLLPKYRGAAPLQWTILNGDDTTGITVQRLVERGKGIDAGDIVGSIGGIVSLQ